MTITIPEWVLWLPLVYAALGLILTPTLLYWANSQISGARPWYHGWYRAVLISPILWPAVIWELWATPRRNRKVIARWREQNGDW